MSVSSQVFPSNLHICDGLEMGPRLITYESRCELQTGLRWFTYESCNELQIGRRWVTHLL